MDSIADQDLKKLMVICDQKTVSNEDVAQIYEIVSGSKPLQRLIILFRVLPTFIKNDFIQLDSTSDDSPQSLSNE